MLREWYTGSLSLCQLLYMQTTDSVPEGYEPPQGLHNLLLHQFTCFWSLPFNTNVHARIQLSVDYIIQLLSCYPQTCFNTPGCIECYLCWKKVDICSTTQLNLYSSSLHKLLWNVLIKSKVLECSILNCNGSETYVVVTIYIM